MKANLEPEKAFVLHSKAYKESSLWLELFCEHSGRVPVIAKGAKRPKSPMKSVLQAFRPLLVMMVGRHDLMTLTSAELISEPVSLDSRSLMAGFYMNELIVKLVHRHDPHPILFQYYAEALHSLSEGADLEKTLRLFEFQLLEDIGYGFEFCLEAENRLPIDKNEQYFFIPHHGFVHAVELKPGAHLFSGASLCALSRKDYQLPQTLRDAKLLTRGIIDGLLGDAKLKTREVGSYFRF